MPSGEYNIAMLSSNDVEKEAPIMQTHIWGPRKLKPDVYTFQFLSPARRGRGILVAPGFRQASSVRRHVFLWAQKLQDYWSLLFEI